MPGRKRAAAAAPASPSMTVVGDGRDAIETMPGTSAALLDAIRLAVYGQQKDASTSSATAVCAVRSRVYRLVIEMIRVSDGQTIRDTVCGLGWVMQLFKTPDIDSGCISVMIGFEVLEF